MNPAPRVETKVKWASLGAYLGSVALLAVLGAVSSDPTLLSPLPDVVEVPLVALIPTIVTFLSGVWAKHTARPDLPMAQR